MEYQLISPDGEHMGSLKYGEDAAAMVALLGDDAKVLASDGRMLWWEGHETQPAAESYDVAADAMASRLR